MAESGAPTPPGCAKAAPTPAQVQAFLGHGALESSARYFRAGTTEQAAVVERIFD